MYPQDLPVRDSFWSTMRMRRIAAALAAMVLASGGLWVPNDLEQPRPRQPARLRRTAPRAGPPPLILPGTQSGRFEVLADLEQATRPRFSTSMRSGAAALTVRGAAWRPGPAPWRSALTAPAVLLADNEHARDWALPRHWQPYELLMASIYRPGPRWPACRSASGPSSRLPGTPPLPLQTGLEPRPYRPGRCRPAGRPGGRPANSPDVQADAWPYTFYLDDLMLADNSTVVYGDPRAPRAASTC